MVVIELTEKVVMEFMEREFKVLNRFRLPFKEFTIKFPLSIFLSKEQVLRDSIEKFPLSKDKLDKTMLKKMEKIAEEYVSGDLSIEFKGEEKAYITVKDSRRGRIFEYHIADLLPYPIVTVNQFARDGELFAFKITNLIAQTLAYIEEPKKEVLVSERREPKNTGKKGKKKSGGKTYIYKKTYKVLDIETKLEKRDYNRVKESWGVRGHWRTYKSGKRVWIEQYTKGNKDTDNEDKTYKVSRLD